MLSRLMLSKNKLLNRKVPNKTSCMINKKKKNGGNNPKRDNKYLKKKNETQSGRIDTISTSVFCFKLIFKYCQHQSLIVNIVIDILQNNGRD
jgi:hypothetical protein